MSHINHEPNLVITPPPATRETQPLRAAPPTARLTPPSWISRWQPSTESLLIIGAAASITIIITALVMMILSVPAPATPEPILYVVAAPTPALSVANVARQEQAIVAHHAPEGAIAGVVLVVAGEEIEVIEQYRGWIRFRTPHMQPNTSAWALASDLVGLVDGARLAAAPEIAPTAQPTAAPVVVYVPQPAAPATRNEPVQLAPVVAPPGAAPTPIGSDLAWYAVPNDGCGGANPPLVCVAAADPVGPGEAPKPNTKP